MPAAADRKDKTESAGCRKNWRSIKQINMGIDMEKLTDYLDNQMNHEDAAKIQVAISQNTGMAHEWQSLNMAVETIRLDAINQKVTSIRSSVERSKEKKNPAIVRGMFKSVLRVAAIAILLVGVASLYKYMSVSSFSVYNNQFAGYELSNVRGADAVNPETEAYQNKNWNRVIETYNEENIPSDKSSFLAAIAAMHLNRFPQAIQLFNKILNSNSGNGSFQEESEYFISLAYIMNHEEGKGIEMIKKIQADPNHTFYPAVSRISSVDLKILRFKNK
jgi:hypothetical protein